MHSACGCGSDMTGNMGDEIDPEYLAAAKAVQDRFTTEGNNET